MSVKKNEIDTEKVLEIIENVNNKVKSMTKYEEELQINRSSIKRRIKEHGYMFNRDSSKWEKGTNEPLIKKDAIKVISKQNEYKKTSSVKDHIVAAPKEDISKNPVGRPKKNGEYKRFNMELPVDLLKALKRKALEEDTTATDIIVKLLHENIEDKYK